MNLARYYAALLFQREKGAPTMAEAQQDFQRMMEWQNSIMWFGA